MLNVFKVDTERGIEEYKSLLELLDSVEPHYLPEYIEVFSGGIKDLMCFSFTADDSNTQIIMPGYLRPIVVGSEVQGYFDFITPYGYTGPMFNQGVKKKDIEQFWNEVDKWYTHNNVITEFIRFNLSDNHVGYSGEILSTMLNVKGKIIDADSQSKAFEHKVRKNVNKAIRENLSCNTYYNDLSDDKIAEFHRIYISTMIRTNAKDNFLYSLENFTDFIRSNKEYAAICTVYFEDVPISSELLLVSKDSIYSFLGGTDENYFDKRPNDFLKVQALNWAREHDKKFYVLGGGYGYEDGIFKYKKTFFPDDVVNYFTGRKIIDKEKYSYFVNKYNEERLERGMEEIDLENTAFFPLYNMPMPEMDGDR